MSSPARSFRESRKAQPQKAQSQQPPQSQPPQSQHPQVQTRQTQSGQTHARPLRTEQQLQALWRARALRYVLIYLLLACALVTLRYQTREVYPNLRTLNETRTQLQTQQRELSLTVQSLTSEQRVRAWALANGMVPYAQANKQTRTFEKRVPLAPPVSAATAGAALSSVQEPLPATLNFRTVWR